MQNTIKLKEGISDFSMIYSDEGDRSNAKVTRRGNGEAGTVRVFALMDPTSNISVYVGLLQYNKSSAAWADMAY